MDPPGTVRPARPEERVIIVPVGDLGEGWDRMKWWVI